MSKKNPHIKLTNPNETPISWSYKTRYVPPIEDEDPVTKDYSRMAFRFEQSINKYFEDKQQRIASRTLQVPKHIEYIDIRFQGQFDLRTFGKQFLKSFGLDTVKLTEFNKRVLFSISDQAKFDLFFEQINAFIEFGKGNIQIKYDKRIIYIEDFTFLSSTIVKQYQELNSIVRFSLLEGLFDFNLFNEIENSLETYLLSKNIIYIFDRVNNNLEIINPTENLVNEIIDNFDIVYSVTSSLSTVIRPSSARLPERSYGFTIENESDALPLIGIIDSGIDRRTPLSSIIIGGIDKTNTNAFEDIVNHGTAVAALAALGKKPYAIAYRGVIKADAKLLSLKVINSSPAALADHTVTDVIKEAKLQYPNIKLFVLTINYENHKKFNEPSSDYAYQLDKLSHELGILIFICTANNNKAADDCTSYAPLYFGNENTNLCSPSESMNNMTIGACADNIKPGTFLGIADLKEFPALFTRVDHLDQARILTSRKINKHLKKPDILQPGGDYESSSMFIGTGDNATMEVLSSDPTESFFKNVGTSFATPLAANLAAQLLCNYPDLNSQSLKALLINSATDELIESDNEEINKTLKRATGNGLPNEDKALFSDSNTVTFIIERSIKHKELIVIPINVPNYLQALSKNKALLKVTATICFSFYPDKDNQLIYCPVFMAFSIFRNKTPNEIKSTYSTTSKLRNTWTQDGYAMAKPIMYSNVQKISFNISKDDIIGSSTKVVG